MAGGAGLGLALGSRQIDEIQLAHLDALVPVGASVAALDHHREDGVRSAYMQGREGEGKTGRKVST